MKSSILLFGGGKETVYNIHKAHKHIKLILCFNYGQKSFVRERQSLIYYSQKFNIPFRIIKLPLLIPDSIKKGIRSNSSDVPFRNPLFLSVAVNYAIGMGIDNIILGSIYNSKKEYTTDNFSNFLDDFSILANKLYRVSFDSPSASLITEQLVNRLVKMDTTHLWFCESNGKSHCGKCNKCVQYKLEVSNGILRKCSGAKKLKSQLFCE